MLLTEKSKCKIPWPQDGKSKKIMWLLPKWNSAIYEQAYRFFHAQCIIVCTWLAFSIGSFFWFLEAVIFSHSISKIFYQKKQLAPEYFESACGSHHWTFKSRSFDSTKSAWDCYSNGSRLIFCMWNERAKWVYWCRKFIISTERVAFFLLCLGLPIWWLVQSLNLQLRVLLANSKLFKWIPLNKKIFELFPKSLAKWVNFWKACNFIAFSIFKCNLKQPFCPFVRI